MKGKFIALLMVLTLVLAAFSFGCAKKTTTTTTTPPPTTTATATSTPTPTPTPTPTSTTTTPPIVEVHARISISSAGFAPIKLTVEVGEETVEWTNMDSVDHNITSDVPGLFSITLAPGEIFVFSFGGIGGGTYTYYDALHPELTGEVFLLDQE